MISRLWSCSKMVDFREIPGRHPLEKWKATLFTELQEEVKHLYKSSTKILQKPKPSNTPKGFFLDVQIWILFDLYLIDWSVVLF